MRKLVYLAALIAAVLVARRAHAQDFAALPDAPLAAAREAVSSDAGDSHDSQPRASDTSTRTLAPVPVYVRSATSSPIVTSRTCASGEAAKQDCREHWTPLLRQTFESLLLEQGMNLATDPAGRYNISHGHWFDHWTDSVANQHLTRWNNGDSFASSYVGHPMMGAVTDSLYIQNDPRGRGLMIGANRAYWMSRLRATAFSSAYSAQWEIGPLSKASIGNSDKRALNNGTGAVDWVMTPVAGTAWSVGEDLIDRQIIWRLEGQTNNRAALLAMSALNPTRSVANLLRGKAPWYRDYRSLHVPRKMLPFQAK